jgi:hypothetical protein
MDRRIDVENRRCEPRGRERVSEKSAVVGVERYTGSEVLIAATRETRAILTKAEEVNFLGGPGGARDEQSDRRSGWSRTPPGRSRHCPADSPGARGHRDRTIVPIGEQPVAQPLPQLFALVS